MNKIIPYIAAFLLGGLLAALYAINKMKPNIVSIDTLNQVEQSVKKLKQSGENNNQEVVPTIEIENKKKFLGIFKRKKEKIMKNWRTTIAGAVMAAIVAVQPIIATGEIDWKAVGIAAAIAILGYLAKDAGVSGVEK